MKTQKAIEWLKAWSATHQNENENVREAVWSGIQALKELEQYRALGTVEELKEAREKQPKTDWIPCEERLPEENTEVLISRNHNVFKISIGYYNKDFGWYDQCQCHMISDVTAWQPLPQPYKKEGTENE